MQIVNGKSSDACIFCKKVRLRANRNSKKAEICKSKKYEDSIKEAAHFSEDYRFLARIEHVNFCEEEVRYHQTCKRRYCNKAKRLNASTSRGKNTISESRESHSTAFKVLVEYVNESIIIDQRPEFMNSILNRYILIVSSLGSDCRT